MQSAQKSGSSETGPLRPVDQHGASSSASSAVRGAFRLIRPLNCLIAAVGVFAAVFVAGGFASFRTFHGAFRMGAGMGVVFLVTGAGNALNDIVDRKTDRVNHPRRPLPAKQLSVRGALVVVVTAFAIGLILAAFVAPLLLVLASAAVALLILYETILKHRGLVGNLCISALTALVFPFGGAITSTREGTLVTALLGLCAFFATLGREIVKDIEDLAGDTDRRTLPKRIGTGRSAGIAFASLAAGVAISPLPWYPLAILSPLYIAVVAAADALFIASGSNAFSDPHRAQQLIKIGMVIAMAAFIIGRI